MKTILFVCTGNVCRSPMAEGIFRLAVEGRGDYQVLSAGLGAAEGAPPSLHAVRAVKDLADVEAHEGWVPSLTTPIALVKHSAVAERIWFQRTLGGLTVEQCDGPAQGADCSFRIEPAERLVEVIAEYRAACRRSDEVAAGHELDDTAEHHIVGTVSVHVIYLGRSPKWPDMPGTPTSRPSRSGQTVDSTLQCWLRLIGRPAEYRGDVARSALVQLVDVSNPTADSRLIVLDVSMSRIGLPRFRIWVTSALPALVAM